MIAIIDYDAGNLQSVVNAIETIGLKPTVTRDAKEVAKADVIVLPGVGAFGDCMNNLRRLNMVGALNDAVLGKKKPFLGICVGLQLLAKKGFEFGEHEGLGWINGEVVKIDNQNRSVRVPHMGWNSVELKRKDGVFADFSDKPSFYFVHSYYLRPDNGDSQYVNAVCLHGSTITAGLQKNNIVAVQFHPEKSQYNGLRFLSNFFKTVGF